MPFKNIYSIGKRRALNLKKADYRMKTQKCHSVVSVIKIDSFNSIQSPVVV